MIISRGIFGLTKKIRPCRDSKQSMFPSIICHILNHFVYCFLLSDIKHKKKKIKHSDDKHNVKRTPIIFFSDEYKQNQNQVESLELIDSITVSVTYLESLPLVERGEMSMSSVGIVCFFFNWDSPHARLNSHYEGWSNKKKKHKKDCRIQKICLERTHS